MRKCSKETRVGDFDETHAAYLCEQLTRLSLPKLSKVEQIRLVSLIDTFLQVEWSCRNEFLAVAHLITYQVENQKKSLDENGGRYVLFMRMFMFSQKAFPPQSRADRLTSRDIAWAFFSESQV